MLQAFECEGKRVLKCIYVDLARWMQCVLSVFVRCSCSHYYAPSPTPNRLLLMEQEEDVQCITPPLRPPFPPYHMCPSATPSPHLILFALLFVFSFLPTLFHRFFTVSVILPSLPPANQSSTLSERVGHH